MGAGRLRTGLLGLDRRGPLLLEALTQIEAFDVVAVADKDAVLANRLAGQYRCKAFDDYRQFIIQNPFDTLIVCAGLHSCLDYVRMAVKKKAHILKWAPMARNFAEATELADLAVSEGVRFDVANPMRYCEGFSGLGHRLSDKTLDRPFLVRAIWDISRPAGDAMDHASESHTAWMTDRQLAGGGVVLHDGYGLIDHLVEGLGIPQQVYCLSRSYASDKAVPYLAEDTAVLIARFDDGLIADLVLMRHWDDRDSCRHVAVYGKGGPWIADCRRSGICDHRGQAAEGRDCGCEEMGVTSRLLRDYADTRLVPDEHPFASDARANLDVMAVIEAAYISTRTGSPEQPAKVLSRAG